MPDDALYRNVTLDHSTVIPVLGIPVMYRSNAEELLALVHEAFGVWNSVPANLRQSVSPQPDIRLITHQSEHPGSDQFVFRMPDADRVLFHTGDGMGIVDLKRRNGVAYVGPQTLVRPQQLRQGVIEMMTLVLVSSLDRTPVHCTLLSDGFSALIVTGASGVGKSTLAYRCRQRKLRVLSDDAAYVQTDPALRVWGMPGPLYVPPESRAFFPDALKGAAVQLPGGKTKIPISRNGRDGLLPIDRRVGLCLVSRDGKPASLRAARQEEVRDAILTGLGPGRDLYGDVAEKVVRLLDTRPAWRLNLPAHPALADEFIDQMFRELRRDPDQPIDAASVANGGPAPNEKNRNHGRKDESPL